MGAKKIHSGYFTGNEEVFWCCRRIRDAGNQLKAIAHGYEEGSVEASFGKFLEFGNIFRSLVYGRSSEPFKLRNVEAAPSLGVSQGIIVA